jgi:hypothetical protein
MAEGFKPPTFRATDVNACSAWREFKEDIDNYFLAADLSEESEERKVAILLYGMGAKYRQVFKTFTLSDDNKKKWAPVVKEFDEYFEPKKLTKLYMKKFDSCMQAQNETFPDYLSRLRELADHCEFGATLDNQLCKQISSGVYNKALRDKLWGEDLALVQVIQKCHLFEQKQESLGIIESKNTGVNFAKTGRGSYRGRNYRGRSRGRGNTQSAPNNQNSYQSAPSNPRNSHRGQGQGQQRGSYRGRAPSRGYPNNNYDNSCGNCGYKHRQGQQCPAKGQQCRFCQRYNHFERVCRRKNAQVNVSETVQDNYYQENSAYQDNSENNTDSGLFVYRGDLIQEPEIQEPKIQEPTVDHNKVDVCMNERHVSTLSKLNQIKWTVHLELCDTEIKLPFKIDTGADCSCISLETYNNYVKRGMINTSTVISGISAPAVKPVGRVPLDVVYNDHVYKLLCEIIDHNIPNLVGLSDSLMMNLICRVDKVQNRGEGSRLFDYISCNSESKDILNAYPDVFQGVGKIPGVVSLKIDKNAYPVAHPPRPIPVALRNAVKDKLDQMESEGIIEKILPGVPTEWCAPMHTVLKKSKTEGPITKDDIRITIDPRDLNDALLREYHPINTVEQVITKTHGSKLFTKLDARQGFFQLVLDNESSRLTSFNTPFGRYCHKRLPMGISVAPEIYQRAMQELFGDIDGCEIIFDDLLLHAHDLESHNKLLKSVLQRARDNNVVFNINKLYLCQPQVEYVGHVLSSDGVKVSPDKVEAVINMPQPCSVSDIQTLLGMVTYTCKFIQNLSSLTEPLRQLMIEGSKPGFRWHWDPCHQKAFEDIKKAMTTTPVLGYYTLNKPITMSVDASQSGLGAVLLQDGRPIHYASKALTASQYNYAQIEKELLAITWGFEKFHTYLYGRSDITVETDHKPLVALKNKPLFQMPLRLQKMFMKIRHHTYNLVHKPGKEIPVPDCMSRLYQKRRLETESEDVFMVNTEEIRSTYSFSSKRLQEVREETKSDPTLQRLTSLLKSPRWPENRSKLNPDLRPYFDFLNELSVVDGIIFKGERVVIPESMRREMLGIIHESHLGMVKCKQLARDVLYWPGLNKQIEDVVSRCATCQKHRVNQQKEPLLPVEVPTRPWQTVATDLFDWEGDKYLIMVDYFSEWFEIEQLKIDSSAKTVIGKTSKWFSIHGIPEKVISDNGPPFQSYAYKDFADKYGFIHQTISPYHSQANGLVEKFVGIAKAMLTKCKETKLDPYLALLNHRNTPRDGVGSPAQRLFGRRTCTRLPTKDTLLESKGGDDGVVTDRLMQDRRKTKSYYDKGSKELPDLYEGDQIRVRTQKGTWEPARLISQHPYRSISVQLPTGSVLRRNRRDILKTRENPGIFQRQLSPEEVDLELDHEQPMQVPADIPTIPNVTQPNTPSTPPIAQNPISHPRPNTSHFGRVRKPNPKYDPNMFDVR